LTDSIPKYTKAKDADISFHKGDTVGQLNDLVSFESVKVQGYSIILIHAGTNDLENLIETGKIHQTTVQELLEFYKQLRNSIRRCNCYSILVFSAILPRRNFFQLFYPYAYRLNFAIEKWCARSNGSCIFIPSYKIFIAYGRPKQCMYSVKDGLHHRGAGKDAL
jgi:hypothetical protein